MSNARQPCSNCPFRLEPRFQGLYPERAKKIVDNLMNDGIFYCHKTTKDDESTVGYQACVGAALFLEHVLPNGYRGNLSFRVEEMTGVKFPTLEESDKVYETADEFIKGVSGFKECT